MDDFALLQSYARDGAQEAFRQLVDRHLGLVYAAAKRQVGSPDLAQDVAQAVFLELAGQASRLRPGPTLGPWLYVVTRRKAIDLMRREGHRRHQERAAADAAAPEPPAADWTAVEPLLDEAMEALGEEDRQAVVLRFFENRSLREVGGVLGVSDDAAQKRIGRALERLRGLLGRRGVAATAAGLAAEITAHAAVSVPAGLAASISAAASAASIATVSAPLIAMTLLQKSLIAAVLVGAAGALYHEQRIVSAQEKTIAGLQTQVDALRRQARDRLAAYREAGRGGARDAAAAPGASGSFDAAFGEIDRHIDQLQQRFASNPAQKIPEMSLLTAKDWIAIAGRHPDLKTEKDWREALSDVRLQAEENFILQAMSPALKAYFQTSQNQLPADPAQLAPYFDPPIDPAILGRYQMLESGSATDAAGGQWGFMGVRISALPDRDYDQGVSFSANGYWTSSVTDYAATQATIAYRAANNGRMPQDPSEIIPYIGDPKLAKQFGDNLTVRRAQPR